MASDARKRRWFELGAESFARERPGVYAEPTYLCPICLEPFGLEALSDRVPHHKRLSIEHVPLESLGGRELLLTCTPCNNTAGTAVDAHAKRKEDVLAAMAGKGDRPHRVVAWIGGVRLNSTLHAQNGRYSITIPKKNNQPGTNEALRGIARRGVEMTLRHEPFSDLGAHISWLRAGYLALFAANGYRLALDPAMEIVRRQIRDPATPLIPFSEVPDDVPLTTQRLLRVQAPEWHAGYFVQFGRYLMHFPGPGDIDFYSRLAENVKEGWPELVCEDFGWPTEATFGVSDGRLVSHRPMARHGSSVSAMMDALGLSVTSGKRLILGASGGLIVGFWAQLTPFNIHGPSTGQILLMCGSLISVGVVLINGAFWLEARVRNGDREAWEPNLALALGFLVALFGGAVLGQLFAKAFLS